MEIKIDTAKDSKEDIRKVIKMLQALADDTSYGSATPAPDASPGLFSLFGDNQATAPSGDPTLPDTFKGSEGKSLNELLAEKGDDDSDDDDDKGKDIPEVIVVDY